MEIEEVVSCPLGHTCVEAKDGKLHRCAWHIKMSGRAQGGSEYEQWNCAIAWQPILMVEVSGSTRGATQAIESLRNETVKRQDEAITLAKGFEDAKEISST